MSARRGNFPRFLSGLALWCVSLAWAGETLNDPTRPPAAAASEERSEAETAVAPPKLTGIRIAGDRRAAILDGAAVGIGATVGGGYEVTLIERGRVGLRRDGVDSVLELLPDIGKRPR